MLHLLRLRGTVVPCSLDGSSSSSCLLGPSSDTGITHPSGAEFAWLAQFKFLAGPIRFGGFLGLRHACSTSEAVHDASGRIHLILYIGIYDSRKHAVCSWGLAANR